VTITPSISAESTESQDKPLILIVDDSKVMRMALRKILMQDFGVVEADNGEAGWSRLLEDPNIQMVFSDLSMPELDGFGLLARVRGADDAHIREIPFIVITGNEDDTAVRERALGEGATDFIGKPFQTVEITARAKSYAKQQDRLKEANKTLEEHTTVDAATALTNARQFGLRAKEALSFAIRQKGDMGLVRLNLDGFAEVMEARGADYTARLLARVGEMLEVHTRHEDVVAHLGEGRFVMLLQATDAAGGRQVGERLLDEIHGLSLDGELAGLTASIGVLTPAIRPESDMDEFMEAAERALDSAVRNGGNCLMADDRGRMELVRHEHEQDETARIETGATDAQGLVDELARAREELAELRRANATRSQELEAAQTQMRELAAELNAQTEARREDAERAALLEAELLELRGQAEGEADEVRRELESLRSEHSRAQERLEEETHARLEAEHASAEAQHGVEEARRRTDAEMARLSLDVKKLQEELARERVAREAAETEACRMFSGLRRFAAKLFKRH